jgi:ATP-binding cassette subfamily C exporter for protease/lipase
MLMLMPAIYMLQLYDSVLTSRNEMTLLMLTLIMLGAYIFMGALEYRAELCIDSRRRAARHEIE